MTILAKEDIYHGGVKVFNRGYIYEVAKITFHHDGLLADISISKACNLPYVYQVYKDILISSFDVRSDAHEIRVDPSEDNE